MNVVLHTTRESGQGAAGKCEDVLEWLENHFNAPHNDLYNMWKPYSGMSNSEIVAWHHLYKECVDLVGPHPCQQGNLRGIKSRIEKDWACITFIVRDNGQLALTYYIFAVVPDDLTALHLKLVHF